ncbi:MAG: hypothetical protein ACPL7B_15225, partial [Candidatus Poribacteria bacterium]
MIDNLYSKHITRRDFIKTAILAGIGISQIAGCAVKQKPLIQEIQQPSDGATVVIIKSEKLAK